MKDPCVNFRVAKRKFLSDIKELKIAARAQADSLIDKPEIGDYYSYIATLLGSIEQHVSTYSVMTFEQWRSEDLGDRHDHWDGV